MRLFELRSNPDKNPKTNPLEYLLKYRGQKDVYVSFTADVGKWGTKSHMVDFHTELNGKNTRVRVMKGVDGRPQTFGSEKLDPATSKWVALDYEEFEAIKDRIPRSNRNISGGKIGINPKSHYETPIGVYTYPIDYVIKYSLEFGEGKMAAPFTGTSAWRYAWVLRRAVPDEAVFDVMTYSEEQLERDIVKLAASYSIVDDGFVKESRLTAKRHADDSDEEESEGEDRSIPLPAATFWNLTRRIAAFVAEDTDRSASVVWTGIMRLLGYRQAADLEGSGLIHSNEPTQAVFFDGVAFETIDVITSTGTFDKATKSLYDTQDKSEFPERLAKAPTMAIYRLMIFNQKMFIQGSKGKIKNKKIAESEFERLNNDPNVRVLVRDFFIQNKQIDVALKFCADDTERQNAAALAITNDPKASTLKVLAENGIKIDFIKLAAAMRGDSDGTIEYIIENDIKIKPEGELPHLLRAIVSSKSLYMNSVSLTYVQRFIEHVAPSEAVIEKLLPRFPTMMTLFLAKAAPKLVFRVLARNPNLMQALQFSGIYEPLALSDQMKRALIKHDPHNITSLRGVDQNLWTLATDKKPSLVLAMPFPPKENLLIKALKADPSIARSVVTLFHQRDLDLPSAVFDLVVEIGKEEVGSWFYDGMSTAEQKRFLTLLPKAWPRLMNRYMSRETAQHAVKDDPYEAFSLLLRHAPQWIDVSDYFDADFVAKAVRKGVQVSSSMLDRLNLEPEKRAPILVATRNPRNVGWDDRRAVIDHAIATKDREFLMKYLKEQRVETETAIKIHQFDRSLVAFMMPSNSVELARWLATNDPEALLLAPKIAMTLGSQDFGFLKEGEPSHELQAFVLSMWPMFYITINEKVRIPLHALDTKTRERVELYIPEQD